MYQCSLRVTGVLERLTLKDFNTLLTDKWVLSLQLKYTGVVKIEIVKVE